MAAVPAIGVRICNDAPFRGTAGYVLYGMIASCRLTHNFAFDRTLEHCRSLGGKALVILEAPRSHSPLASDRLHLFVLKGLGHNSRTCAKHGIPYYRY